MTNRIQGDIAVVGVSALFPGSTDGAGFWRDILSGRDLMMDVPPTHWRIDDYYDPDPAAKDKVYANRGAFLEPVPFDPLEFGILPNAVPATDSAQLLALIVAKRVLHDATRGRMESLDRDRVSVILGVASATELVCSMSGRLQRPVWRKALRESGLPESQVESICARIAEHYVPWQESTFPGLLGNVVVGRIANRLDLGGSNFVVDAACASSLSALAMGINELHLDQADLVVTGGVDALNDILMYACFAETTALSPTGDCRPFADGADGTMLGEGVGLFALRRLADAERDGNPIYALIKGLGSSSDGRARSIYGPLPDGQAKALRRAYAQAGYTPRTVELVEAHGTGTKAGDRAEFEGLVQVFEAREDDRQWCALGSVKSQIGHTKAAAGAAGLFKVVMALHHKVLPPTTKVDRPNATLAIEESAFYLNMHARPWMACKDHPRRASVSSFGFGGTNYHLTLEEYRGPGRRPARQRALAAELIALSADDAGGLRAICDAAPDELEEAGSLQTFARATQDRFDVTARHRLAVVAKDVAHLAQQVEQACARVVDHPGEGFALSAGLHYATEVNPGKLAFLFPGQGSQYLYMGSELALHFDAARTPWEAAPVGVASVVFPPSAFEADARQAQVHRLTEMANAQPAIAAVSLGQLALLRAAGVEPDCVGGHSFGELTALHAAGCLSADALLVLARRRGELMADAAAGLDGAMLAVETDRDSVAQFVQTHGLTLAIANHNAPRQVVLSGATDEIERAAVAFRETGIAARRLPVATAFHSTVVSASSEPLATYLATCEFEAPGLPVYANATAAPYPEDPDAIRVQLAGQLTQPVRFVEQIDALFDAGVRTFVEVGPGRVLSGLVRQCLEGRPHTCVTVDDKLRGGLFGLCNALGQLAVNGVAVDFEPLWSGFAEPAPVPKRGPHVLQISGANYGKPYPGGVMAPPDPVAGTVQAEPAAAMAGSPATPMASPTVAPAPVSPAPPHASNEPYLPVPTDVARSAEVEAMQRELADVQRHFQQTMTDAHLGYLQLVAQSLSALGGQPPEAMPSAHAIQPPGEGLAPVDAPCPDEHRIPATMPPPPHAVASAPVSAASEAPLGINATLTATPAAQTPVSMDTGAILLELVAEKTGYPPEMLELDMELEAELGIDSIKRVEILAAAQERMPEVQALDTAVLGEMKTLREISEHLGTAAGAPAPSNEREAHVPSEGKAGQSRGSSTRTLQRLALARVDAVASNEPLPGLVEARSIVITPDDGDVAPALAAAFDARGLHATVSADPGDDADAVVCLDGLCAHADPATSLQTHARVFDAARRVAPRYANGQAGIFVTVHDSGGDFGASGDGQRAWLAGVPGIAKSAALEWPGCTVKSVDLERGGRSPDEIAKALVAELFGGGDMHEVGLKADGRRVVLESRPESMTPGGQAPVTSGEVVVVSGGARGVAAHCCEALARAFTPHLLLLGRTPLNDEPACCAGLADVAAVQRALLDRARQTGESPTPTELSARCGAVLAAREVRATLARIAQTGATVRYVNVDVCDVSGVAEAIDAARATLGPIRGIVHAAGVLADKRIEDKSPAQFERVFRTKVDGLHALLAATAADPLQFISLFGSVAARRGNAGQCDYAAANEVLNRVALAESRRRGDACLVKVLNWGPWDGGMVTPALRTHFEHQGVALIPKQLGAEHFVNELCGARGGAVELLIGAASVG
ncbi:MAG: SDR family NAD(P)-dependent oxidoreductase [Gammaproteobacteria bacterium]